MKNIDYIKNDKIDRRELVDKVYDIVNSLKENKNICLAINGEWGSGKSYVMGMLDEKFVNSDRYIVIKYDAWENNFYNDPLIAILTCIYDALEDKIKHIEHLQEKQIKEISKSAANTVSKLMPFLDVLRIAINGIKDVLEKYHNPINTERLEDFKSYRTLLHDTRNILNNLTISCAKGLRQKKIVILVDEIDRCLPNEQLKILERLHHLFDVNNCAVIVAVNEHSVSKTINTLYGVDGYEYLRKFFDYTYKLELNSKIYLRNLLYDYIEILQKSGNDNSETINGINDAFVCLSIGKIDVFDKIDNRDISRYFYNLSNIINNCKCRLNYQNTIYIILSLFIRENICADFLSIKNIRENQNKIGPLNDSDVMLPKDSMPYFDYMKKYLGIDRENLDGILPSINVNSNRNLSSISYIFNEMILYSDPEAPEFKYFEYRQSFGYRYPINEACQYLRNLVIKYAGEQYRNIE